MDEVAPGIRRLELRTPTLPPATHTGCYVVGSERLTVVEPASPWPEEQARLLEALAALVAAGARVDRVVLTHHHADHVSGARALVDALARLGSPAPLLAHAVTADLLRDDVPVDGVIAAGDVLDCGERQLVVHHTPGHAPGHVVLQDPESGALIAGDMVAGVGTILIDPVEGDLGDYLASLERLRGLAPSVLLPAHGPALTQADAVLGFVIAHRHQRTVQIRDALDRHGAATPAEIAGHVYPELDAALRPLAEVQVLTHLLWLQREGLARATGSSWRAA